MSKVNRMEADRRHLRQPAQGQLPGQEVHRAIDGQHTIVGLKTLNGGKDLSIVAASKPALLSTRSQSQ